jgi:hypothetical protein
MIDTVSKAGTSPNASSIFAVCRYAFKSEYAFMSGWYMKDPLAVDIACVKHQFTSGYDEKDAPCLHTGNFMCTRMNSLTTRQRRNPPFSPLSDDESFSLMTDL